MDADSEHRFVFSPEEDWVNDIFGRICQLVIKYDARPRFHQVIMDWIGEEEAEGHTWDNCLYYGPDTNTLLGQYAYLAAFHDHCYEYNSICIDLLSPVGFRFSDDFDEFYKKDVHTGKISPRADVPPPYLCIATPNEPPVRHVVEYLLAAVEKDLAQWSRERQKSTRPGQDIYRAKASPMPDRKPEQLPPPDEPVVLAANTEKRWRRLKQWVMEECVHDGTTIGDVHREANGLELASVLDSLVVEARQTWNGIVPLWEDVPEDDETDHGINQRSVEACMATCGRTFRCMLEAEGWLCKNSGPEKADEILDRAADALSNIWEVMMLFPAKPTWLSTPGINGEGPFQGFCEDLHEVAADLRQLPELSDDDAVVRKRTDDKHKAQACSGKQPANVSGKAWEKHTSPSCLYHLSVQEVCEVFDYWYGWGSVFDEEMEELPNEDDPRIRYYGIVVAWISMLADVYELSSKRFMDAARIYMRYAMCNPYVISIPENITDIEDDQDGPTDQERRELTDGLEVFHATRARYYLAIAEASTGATPTSGPTPENAPGDYTVIDAIKYLDTISDPLSIHRMIGIGICADEVAKGFAYFASAGGKDSLPSSHGFFLKYLSEWVESFCRLPSGFAEKTIWYSPRMAAAVEKLSELMPSLLYASRQNTGKITPVDKEIIRRLRQAAVALSTEMTPGKPDAESLKTNLDTIELPGDDKGRTLESHASNCTFEEIPSETDTTSLAGRPVEREPSPADPDRTQFLHRDLEQVGVLQERVRLCADGGDLAGVLAVLAEHLLYWGCSLKRHMFRFFENFEEGGFGARFYRSGASPSWFSFPPVGTQEAFEMLEFHKDIAYARAFKARFDQWDDVRRGFVDFLVSYDGRTDDPTYHEFQAEVDDRRSDLRKRTFSLADYVNLLANQVVSLSRQPPASQPQFRQVDDAVDESTTQTRGKVSAGDGPEIVNDVGEQRSGQASSAGTTEPAKTEPQGQGRGPYFLTVRLPYILLGTAAAEDPVHAIGSGLTHEKEINVFYDVDSEVIGEKLLEMFRYGKPEPRFQGDPSAPVGSLEGMRNLVGGISQPIFDLVNAADLDPPQRVLFREHVGLLQEIESLGDGDPDIWAKNGLPHDKRAVLLMQHRRQAQRWERIIREQQASPGAPPEVLRQLAGTLRDWAEADKGDQLQRIFRDRNRISIPLQKEGEVPSEDVLTKRAKAAEFDEERRHINELGFKAAEAAAKAYPILSWCAINLSCPAGPVSQFMEAARSMKEHREVGKGPPRLFSLLADLCRRYRHRSSKRFDETGAIVDDAATAAIMQIAEHIEKWASEVPIAYKDQDIPSAPQALGKPLPKRAGEDDWPTIADAEQRTLYSQARQVDLVAATNQVLGKRTLNPGVLSRVVTRKQILSNGLQKRDCRVDVASFLAWIRGEKDLQEDEVTQIRNAVIGEIDKRIRREKGQRN